MTSAPPALTAEQIEALGDELDELRGRTIADLGERDAAYIRTVIKAQRALEIGGPRHCCSRASCRRRGSAAPPRWRSPRSSTTWRSATT